MELKETLVRSLICENASEKLVELDNERSLEKIIPQVNEMKEVGECKYHVVNCFDHSIKSLEEFECIIKEENFFADHLKVMIWKYLNTSVQDNLTRLDILKLGIFLHDVGKPESKTIDENGRVHFKGHEVIGGDIVKRLGKQIKLNDLATKTLFNYVRYHMILLVLYKRNDLTQDILFDTFEKIGEDIIGIMLLGYADIVATRKLLDPNEQVGTIKTYMEFILTNYEYRYKRLK